jgi:thiol-disulfide isomerase/thioredoxin
MDAGVATLIAVIAVSSLFGLRRMVTEGRVDIHKPGHRFTHDELGHDMGSAATLVQFSSPYCQPCRATHEMLETIAAEHDGVLHVDMQVADHLDLVNRLHILRTPTTVMLDRSGHVRFRSEGVPRKDDLLDALHRVTRHS